MIYYSPRNSKAVRGKYDITALKGIMDNCELFKDWRVWFQTFYDVGKIRNNVIGHNAQQRVENTDMVDHFRVIKSMFKELWQISDDSSCKSKTKKRYG